MKGRTLEIKMKLLCSVRLVYTPLSLPSQSHSHALTQLSSLAVRLSGRMKRFHLTILQLQVTGSWARAWECTVLSTGSVFQKQGQGIGSGRDFISETVWGRPIGRSTLISPTKLLEGGYSLLPPLPYQNNVHKQELNNFQGFYTHFEASNQQ